MTDREKMIEAINRVQAYGIMSNAFGGDLPVTNEMLADALIAAGYGEVEEAKRKAFVYSREIAHLDNKLKETEHRAEVAEKALPLQDDKALAFFEFSALCLLQARVDERLTEELDQGEIDVRNYMFVRSIIKEEIERYAQERGIIK